MITKWRIGFRTDDDWPQKLEQHNLAQKLDSEQADGRSQKWEKEKQNMVQKEDREEDDGLSQKIGTKVGTQIGFRTS